MKMVKELLRISLVYILALMLEFLFSIPSGLAGMGILFLLLITKILKPEDFPILVPFALIHLAFFFIPPAVAILEAQGITLMVGVKILAVLVLSNFLVMGITGFVMQRMIQKRTNR